MNAAVFIDRDNTLIENEGDLGDPDAVRLIQGTASAIAALCGLGYKVVVVTNQGGVARGKFTEKDVEAVHQRIREQVEHSANGARIDRFYYCPFHPQGRVSKYQKDHPDRKPKPGMMLQAASEMKLDLAQCWTIGDQIRDVEAGRAAGTRTILIDSLANGSIPKQPSQQRQEHTQPDYTAKSLVEAVRIVAQQRKPETVRQPQHRLSEPKRWDAAAVAELQHQSMSSPAPPSNDPARAEELTSPTRQVKPQVMTGQSSDAKEVKPSGFTVPPARTRNMNILRQILQELRQLRGEQDDFALLRVLAIVLQMVALLCLLAAFWMGQDDQGTFARCLGTGLLVQLTTIAILLFSK